LKESNEKAHGERSDPVQRIVRSFYGYIKSFLICFIIGMCIGTPFGMWLAQRSVKREMDEYFKLKKSSLNNRSTKFSV
jgi:hypothetical protein